MFIKQIIIQGFKSYKDQGVLKTSFSPKNNVVVGRNGSGKSNFFDAILFVLSDKYSKLRDEERQQLLHEGTGRGVMVAFVEIIFDNKSRRIPINKDEVRIKRMIGLKKDEYVINGKKYTQREVLSILESSGFSSANPYYVVEQGKVSRLATMKPQQRLELLKEVAGTKVYDERLKKSRKILTSEASKRVRIHDTIERLKEKVEELDKERKKLKKFNKLDKKQRCIEYTIYDEERKVWKEKIEMIEEARDHWDEKSASSLKIKGKREETIRLLVKEYDALKTEIDSKKKTEATKNERMLEIEEKIKKIELEIHDENSLREKTISDRNKLQNERKKVKKEIDSVRKKLNEKLLPGQSSLQDSIREQQNQLAKSKLRQQELFVKEGAGENHQTKRDRDQWLCEQLQKLQRKLSEMENSFRKQEMELKKHVEKLTQMGENVSSSSSNVSSNEKKRKRLIEKRRELFTRRDDLIDQKKKKWNEIDDISRDLVKCLETKEAKEKELEGMCIRSIIQGQKSAKEIAGERGIRGVWGTVLENFSCFPSHRVAIEAIGRNSVFNVIVDDQKIANSIIDIMNKNPKRYPGRVTFLPLRQLSYVRTPENLEEDNLVSLTKCMTFNERFKAAFYHVFGKSYICKDLIESAAAGKKYKVNIVTLEGDIRYREGYFRGGAMNKRSRIEVQSEITELIVEENTLKENKQNLDETLDETIEPSLKEVVVQLRELEQKLKGLDAQLLDDKSELRRLKNRRLEAQRNAKIKEKDIEVEKMNIQQQQQRIESYQKEMESEFIGGNKLTKFEENELNKLNEEDIPNLIEKIKKMEKKLNDEYDGKIKKLQEKLKSNYLIREDELQKELDELELKIQAESKRKMMRDEDDDDDDDDEDEDDNEGRKKELNGLNEEKRVLTEELDSVNSFIRSQESELSKKEAEIEGLKKKGERSDRLVDESANQLEKLLNQKKIYKMKETLAESKIRELGVVSDKYLQKYESWEKKKLEESLHELKKEIKENYSHINKKANDDYEDTYIQKEEFVAKEEELEKGLKAIHKLIDTLNRKRYEAIWRTLNQIKTNFQEFFGKIVQHGEGILHVEGDVDEKSEREEEEEEREGKREDEEENEKMTKKKKKKSKKRNRESMEDEEDTGGETETDDEGLLSFSQKSKKEDANHKKKIETSEGVEIKVRFTSEGEYQTMSQLSGGQKTIVAICLIFAIQKVDPAPFYLFDEIDSALDSQYRASVASLIKSIANERKIDGEGGESTTDDDNSTMDDDNDDEKKNTQFTQFITTTFKNELVDAAEQCFKIEFRNKVSKMVPITKKQARAVLKEEEKVLRNEEGSGGLEVEEEEEETKKMSDEDEDEDDL